jgi:hypothetical protein
VVGERPPALVPATDQEDELEVEVEVEDLGALVFGLLSGQVDKLAAGAPTPDMGVLERISIGGGCCGWPSLRWSCGEQAGVRR